MAPTEPITLREYVVLSGILGTTDLVRASQWVGVPRGVGDLPEPILSAFGSSPTSAYRQRVESYLSQWTELLRRAAAHPPEGGRSSRKVNRIQSEAREICEAALAALLGTAWLSALLEIDDALDSPEESQLQAARVLAESGLLDSLAKPELASRLETWASRDPVSFGVALSKLGALVTALAGSSLRARIGSVAGGPRLGTALTSPLLDILGRPGWLSTTARHETYFEGAHDVLCIAATAGGRPELLEAAVRVLACGVNWAQSCGDKEAARLLGGRIDTCLALYLPRPHHPVSSALRAAATAIAEHWDAADFELLAPPVAWRPPADYAAVDTRWAAAAPEVVRLLDESVEHAAGALASWISAQSPESPALPSAALALGQFGLDSSTPSLESLRATAVTPQTAHAAERALRAIAECPANEGFPELARRWLLELDAALPTA